MWTYVNKHTMFNFAQSFSHVYTRPPARLHHIAFRTSYIYPKPRVFHIVHACYIYTTTVCVYVGTSIYLYIHTSRSRCPTCVLHTTMYLVPQTSYIYPDRDVLMYTCM